MKKKKLLKEIELELSSKELIKCSGLLNGSSSNSYQSVPVTESKA